jgi:hypothetical protein
MRTRTGPIFITGTRTELGPRSGGTCILIHLHLEVMQLHHKS